MKLLGCMLLLLALVVTATATTGSHADDDFKSIHAGHASADSYSKQTSAAKSGKVTSNRRLLEAPAEAATTTTTSAAATTTTTSTSTSTREAKVYIKATSVTCPKGTRRVKCKADICEEANCPSNSTCVIQACGTCKASCIHKVPMNGSHVETEPVAPEPITPRADVNTTAGNSSDACADGSAPVNCLVNPCATMLCAPPMVCQASYCGGCNATCTLPAPPADVSSDGLNISIPLDGIAASEFNQKMGPRGPRHAAVKGGGLGRCKDGSTPVDCPYDPCKPPGGFHFLDKCGPGSVCEAATCGGCNFICRPVQTPNSPVSPWVPAPSTCADGSKPVKCFVDPCETKNCAGDELCIRDYCGGCNASCKKREQSPDKSSNAPTSPWVPAPSTCADGSNPVECFVDPCETKNCAEGELCVRDYCGGCNASCKKPDESAAPPATCSKCPFDPCIATSCLAGDVCEADCDSCSGVCRKPAAPVVTQNPDGSCSDGKPPVRCLADPCSTLKCGNGMVCESNYCGGCNALCKKP